MKTYGGVEVYLHEFRTSAQNGSKWSASRSGRFTPGERAHGIHWIGRWVGPRGGLDAVAKRRNPIIATVGNLTPVVQPVA
jgi:hypothetical protein